jgi:hypothetical protein
MFISTKQKYALSGAVLVVLALAGGCNSSTDDPKESSSRVSVAAFSPSFACADVDGEQVDLDGDGTDETVFESVPQTVRLQARSRDGSNETFSDVIFTNVVISYDMQIGPPPPSRSNGIAVTVPAGGTGEIGLDSILADDIITYWIGNYGVRGTIRFKFTGSDAGGEPVSASGATPIEAAGACGGS